MVKALLGNSGTFGPASRPSPHFGIQAVPRPLAFWLRTRKLRPQTSHTTVILIFLQASAMLLLVSDRQNPSIAALAFGQPDVLHFHLPESAIEQDHQRCSYGRRKPEWRDEKNIRSLYSPPNLR